MVKKKEIGSETEQKVLDAARIVFISKGMDGARMQEIADQAGINKALLHYYFRSKENLFERVFTEAVGKALPSIGSFMISDKPFWEKVKFFIDNYLTLIMENPFIPNFIVQEINRDPQNLIRLMQQNNIDFTKIIAVINQDIIKANLRPISAEHFIMNLIGLCVFPFVAAPMLTLILCNGDTERFNSILLERKTVVFDFVKYSLEKNNL